MTLHRYARGALGLAFAASPLALTPVDVQAQSGPSCSVHSLATAAPVVELYTSEGCSSCPPAEQWLSRLKADPGVVALAFHVDYWDRLGWKDRYASADYSRRQSEQKQSSGARFIYTPQVIFDGADRSDWTALPASLAGRDRPSATVDVALVRDGNRYLATIEPAAPGSQMRLAAFWAVTEQGHVSAVKAGENNGATLIHDFVVRDYRPVATWTARSKAPVSLTFEPSTSPDPSHSRQINLVVVNAESGRPVQAVKLGC